MEVRLPQGSSMADVAVAAAWDAAVLSLGVWGMSVI